MTKGLEKLPKQEKQKELELAEERKAGRELAFALVNLDTVTVDPLGREPNRKELFRAAAQVSRRRVGNELVAAFTPTAWIEEGNFPEDFQPSRPIPIKSRS